MSSRLDIINGIKRIEQPTGLSPVVIFKYKATPTLPLTLDENNGICPCQKMYSKVIRKKEVF